MTEELFDQLVDEDTKAELIDAERPVRHAPPSPREPGTTRSRAAAASGKKTSPPAGSPSGWQESTPSQATGGHFATWEQPQLFSEEVRAGFRPLRK
jgi:hypothetical protein